MDALSDALGHVDPHVLKTQIGLYVPPDVQQMLASAGIRDEYVFPSPVVLEQSPQLVGYYRLLLGQPQKSFYGSATGMGLFKSMETRGRLSPQQRGQLPAFCEAMGAALADLVRQMSPSVTPRDIQELPLLTLGAQFQGANNVSIGQQATLEVFLAISDIVEAHLAERDNQKLTVVNASGRTVSIILAADPDVRVEEDFAGSPRKKVAIEIKGGTDRSNAHNRAGEAGKSHQKARSQGFRDYWTIIAKKGLDMDKLRSESPTTNAWFDATQVLGREGPDWDEFRRSIADQVGIPLD